MMAVPALKIDGAAALLAAWPEPRGRGRLGGGGARARAAGGSPSAARRCGATSTGSSPTRPA